MASRAAVAAAMRDARAAVDAKNWAAARAAAEAGIAAAAGDGAPPPPDLLLLAGYATTKAGQVSAEWGGLGR
jgi:hypothetical protein